MIKCQENILIGVKCSRMFSSGQGLVCNVFLVCKVLSLVMFLI